MPDLAVREKPLQGRNWIMGAEAFERKMPHHDGIKALWESKWKFPVSIVSLNCRGLD